MTNKIRLLIADDHEVVRSGLKTMLTGTEPRWSARYRRGRPPSVRSGKRSRRRAVGHPHARRRRSDRAGADQARQADMPIVILSTFDNPTYVARAVALGASGYLLKGCTREQLINTIRIAAAGESAWTRDELRRVTGALATPRLTADVEVPLTSAKAKCSSSGLWTDEQGDRQHLHISYETVRSTCSTSCGRSAFPIARKPQSGPSERNWSRPVAALAESERMAPLDMRSSAIRVLFLAESPSSSCRTDSRRQTISNCPRMTCGAGVSAARAAETAAPQNSEVMLGQLLRW